MIAGEEKVCELLALQATEGLETAEIAHVNELLAHHPELQDESFERAAAAIHLALIGPEQPMPKSLESRILADWHASQFTSEDTGSAKSPEARRQDASSRTTGLGWWAAAAALLLALFGWWPRLVEPPRAETRAETLPASSAEQQRAALLKTGGTLELPFSATEDPSAAGAGGDVLWNASEQTGFLRISGLEANDPSISQYQLWIFDRTRDERYPVDGGVFDIPAGRSGTIVAIDAQVEVSQPVLFAVTVERPGGVVVSARERIVLVAQS